MNAPNEREGTGSSDAVASTGSSPRQVAGRSILRRLYHGETDFDFIGRARLWFGLSTLVILIGLVGLFARGGLNLGIDFEGGNQWTVAAEGKSIADATEAMEGLGFTDVNIQTIGPNLRVQSETIEGGDAQRSARNREVVAALSELTGTPTNDIDVSEVGPSWGDEISSKALRALVVFLVAIGIYITLRFELRMAVATVFALVHDILVVVGVYALLQLPVTPATVVAILTILGFSIYDGIVVFDRVDENTRLLSSSSRTTYSGMVNDSLNQVLMRSLNTQITAILPIFSVLIVGSLALGASTLQEFGLALFVGQLSGAYSSIFIASPALAWLKEREPRYQALRKRLDERDDRAGQRAARAGRVATDGPPTDEDHPAEEPVTASSRAALSRSKTAGAAATGRTASSGAAGAARTHPPRPRKKGKRR